MSVHALDNTQPLMDLSVFDAGFYYQSVFDPDCKSMRKCGIAPAAIKR